MLALPELIRGFLVNGFGGLLQAGMMSSTGWERCEEMNFHSKMKEIPGRRIISCYYKITS